jgi:dihydrofolate synthase/folylpolyglutamate synthase
MAFESYHEAVRYLVDEVWHGDGHSRRPDDPEARIRSLLNAIGEPQTGFPVIHIGGTTGKGSTAAMTAAALEEAGYRVGLYVSPFLQTFIERISVNGVLMAPERFAGAVEELKPSVGRAAARAGGTGQPTILEILFAVGMLHFSRERVDAAVVEVGLGGRTDCTNVFEPAAVSVITNVQLDHTKQLGDTTAAIAREKAAIIKAGTRAVTGATGDALAVIESRCRDEGVDLWRAGYEVEHQSIGCEVHVGTPRTTAVVTPAMSGAHQVDNATLAVAAADAFSLATGMAVNAGAMAAGVGRARQPGRLEVVQREPTVILDGAHNPAAAEVLAAALNQTRPGGRLILLIGILADKDREGILGRLVPLADHVVVTRPPLAERAGDTAEVARMARPYLREGAAVELIEEPGSALDQALDLASEEDTICITGSIYLIGQLRNRWFPEDQILRERRIRYASL